MVGGWMDGEEWVDGLITGWWIDAGSEGEWIFIQTDKLTATKWTIKI